MDGHGRAARVERGKLGGGEDALIHAVVGDRAAFAHDEPRIARAAVHGEELEARLRLVVVRMRNRSAIHAVDAHVDAPVGRVERDRVVVVGGRRVRHGDFKRRLEVDEVLDHGEAHLVPARRVHHEAAVAGGDGLRAEHDAVCVRDGLRAHDDRPGSVAAREAGAVGTLPGNGGDRPVVVRHLLERGARVCERQVRGTARRLDVVRVVERIPHPWMFKVNGLLPGESLENPAGRDYHRR